MVLSTVSMMEEGNVKQGKRVPVEGGGVILNKVAKQDLTEEHTSEQFLEGDVKEQCDIWAESTPGEGHSQCRALRSQRA